MKTWRIVVLGMATATHIFAQAAAIEKSSEINVMLPIRVEGARQILQKIVERTPQEIADQADQINAQSERVESQRLASVGIEDSRRILKKKFQREFATAPDDGARKLLLSEYISMQRTIAAQRELNRPLINQK